jgi:hypothetical protein
MQQQQIHCTKITTVQNEHLFTTTVSFVRAAVVLAKGRMRPAGRMFDMPGLEHTGCVGGSGDFTNVRNSKCFHLCSFNLYEHNVLLKEFRFFQFQINPFNNLTH